ncbi:MAG: J domain-containing protein [Solirubrobacterales bacterium]
MPIRLALAVVALVALWWGARWFTRANPKAVMRAVTGAGLAGLVVLGAWLVLTGKLAGLLAVAAGLSPWIMRLLRLHAFWQMLRQAGLRMRGGQASAGNTSTVETRFLRMTLDHDSGRMDGEILEGPGRGGRLSDLDFDMAMDLWRRVQVDPQSAQVLEAWLDRTWPDWRTRQGAGDEPEQPAPTGAMTAAEAWEILGLAPGADAEAIKAAHRRLMRLVHPDHGGSTWLAARINQARDLLLGLS